jgi:predicted HTH domain antitoxin
MSTMTLDLPAAVRDEVSAAVEAGIYADEEAFVADAVRALLAARPDVQEAVACRLYERGVYSLGKAAEWSSLDVEQIKLALHRREIEHTAPETPEEVEAMARAALRTSGESARYQGGHDGTDD